MNDWELKPAGDLHLPSKERYRSYRREGGLVESVAQWMWLTALRQSLGTWNRMQVEGRENLPAEPPFVLVANHASHLDALVLSSMLSRKWRDRIFPLAAADVFFECTPVAAFAATFVNALPVSRKDVNARGLRQMRERLLGDQAIYILFPEGVRSRDGQMNPFKPGVGMLIAGTPVPVIPCHLDGTFEALPAGRWIPRCHPIRVRIGRASCYADVPNKKEGWLRISMEQEAAIRALAPDRPG